MANLVRSLKQIFCKNICPLRPSGLSILPVTYLSIPSLSNTGPLLPSPPFSLNLNSPLVLICHVVCVPILDRMPFEKPKVDEHLEHHSCGHPQYCTNFRGCYQHWNFYLVLELGFPRKILDDEPPGVIRQSMQGIIFISTSHAALHHFVMILELPHNPRISACLLLTLHGNLSSHALLHINWVPIPSTIVDQTQPPCASCQVGTPRCVAL